MPRISREENIGKCNHILIKGNKGEEIFGQNEYKDFFIDCLVRFKTMYNVKLLAYCIMDSHAHLVTECEQSDNLSSFFNKLNVNYARFYNSINKRSGKVFDGRFLSETISSQFEFINCIVFIHSNPQIISKVENMISYDYSSYNSYLSETGILDFDNIEKYTTGLTPEMVKNYSKIDVNRWLEDNNSKQIIVDNKIKELLKKHKITSRAQLWNSEILYIISRELITELKLSIRSVAEYLEIGRETLRKIIAKYGGIAK